MAAASDGPLPRPPHGTGERHARPVREVRDRGGLEHLQVGAGSGADASDGQVRTRGRAGGRATVAARAGAGSSPSRPSATAPPSVAARTASSIVSPICRTAVATQNAIEVV